MDEDNLMPNDGTYMGGVPAEPRNQVSSRRKERAETLQALPILKAHIERLNERIAFYEKTTSIPEEMRADKDKFMAVSNAYALTAENLISERDYLQGLVEDAE